MKIVIEFVSLFRKDYDKMKESDIETCIRNYLTSGEFNHEAYHPARDFLSGLLDITIVKPVIEFFYRNRSDYRRKTDRGTEIPEDGRSDCRYVYLRARTCSHEGSRSCRKRTV